MASCAAADSGQGPSWLCLPTSLLPHIFRLANTWQSPGSCLCAPVCRAWRDAAAGASKLRLLYHVGDPVADQSMAAWLKRNGHQLRSLIITAHDESDMDVVLSALADAATTAAAAGRPLPLSTLRVLGHSISVSTIGRLVGGLVNLTTLQLSAWEQPQQDASSTAEGDALVQQHLAALQQATQLQDLYLRGPIFSGGYRAAVAGLLPTSLKRFSWYCGKRAHPFPSLVHLAQLSHLGLLWWSDYGPSSSQLPADLQELNLANTQPPTELLLQQPQVLVGLETPLCCATVPPLNTFTRLGRLSLWSFELGTAAMKTALAQLTSLVTLKVIVQGVPNNLAHAAAAPRLRHLQLSLRGTAAVTGLGTVTQVTSLTLELMCSSACVAEQQSAWVQHLGALTGLRWLSVPTSLLPAVQASVGAMKQLQVLVLQLPWSDELRKSEEQVAALQQVMRWLEGCGGAVLLPGLLLGLSDVEPRLAASLNLRRRLQQVLGSSKCEAVVAADLEGVFDPIQQLAGVPAELQEALA